MYITKPGDRIAFSTWPAELVNRKLFDVMAKYLSPSLPSPSEWRIPQVIEKRLLESNYNVKDIHFERGVINKPVKSKSFLDKFNYKRRSYDTCNSRN